MDDLEIELGPAGTIHGVVLNASGAPLEGARIKVYGRGANGRECPSGADGRFMLDGLGPGHDSVFAETTAGGWKQLAMQVVDLPERGSADVRLTLGDGAGAAISGQVHGVAGADVAGCVLVLSGAGSSRTLELTQSGQYRAEGLAPGEYRIVVRDPAGKLAPDCSTTVVLARSDVHQDLDYAAPVPTRLRGRVATADGHPIPGASVEASMRSRSRRASLRTTTDATGRYELVDLRPGTHFVSARLEGYAVDTVMWEVEPGQQIDQNFTLRLDCWLSGQVLDELGRPVPGASLEVRDSKGAIVRVVPLAPSADGSYEVRDLRFGEYWLSAVAPGRAPSTTARPMRVGGGVGGRVDFRLGDGGGLWIQVLDAAGRPAVGRQVRLGRVLDGVEPDGPALPSADWAPPRTTDGDGVVQVRLLEPGLSQRLGRWPAAGRRDGQGERRAGDVGDPRGGALTAPQGDPGHVQPAAATARPCRWRAPTLDEGAGLRPGRPATTATARPADPEPRPTTMALAPRPVRDDGHGPPLQTPSPDPGPWRWRLDRAATTATARPCRPRAPTQDPGAGASTGPRRRPRRQEADGWTAGGGRVQRQQSSSRGTPSEPGPRSVEGRSVRGVVSGTGPRPLPAARPRAGRPARAAASDGSGLRPRRQSRSSRLARRVCEFPPDASAALSWGLRDRPGAGAPLAPLPANQERTDAGRARRGDFLVAVPLM